MFTVVSLNVDLAGEPDTIDFTLALCGFFFLLSPPNLLLFYPSLRAVAERLRANLRSD